MFFVAHAVAGLKRAGAGACRQNEPRVSASLMTVGA